MTLGLFAQRDALKEAGLKDTSEMRTLGAAVKENPAVYALSQSIAKDPTIDDNTQKKFLIALGKKWKSDPTVFNNLEADMKADPELAGRITTTVKSNPDILVASLEKYAGGDLLPKPAAAAPAAQAANAPVAPTPNGAGQQAPAAAATPAAQPANSPTSAKVPPPEENEETEFLTALAGLSDAEMKKKLDKDVVKEILKGMADQAETKFGVSAATVAGFKNRIGAGDPKLADDKLLTQITTNFQNNPEFVRQLAKAAKNKEPMDKAMVDMARPTMTGVMENPEKLADDKYVKDLSQKMNMGSTLGGFGKILDGIFGEGTMGKISGWFHGIINQISSWLSGFFGDKKVVSMVSGPGGTLAGPVINLAAKQANEDAAAAQKRYSASQMTALSNEGTDGKFFHEEQVIGSDGKPSVSQDGKPVTRTVMNGAITITDINGKQHSVMPAVGQLQANQDKDGNVYGRFVTKINQGGGSEEIATYIVSEKQFKEYEAATNKIAKDKGLKDENGDPRKVAFSAYTAQDAANEAKGQTIQIVSVDRTTGDASPVRTIPVGAPQEANPSVGYTVVNGTVMRKPDPAANDPEFALRGNG